MNTNHKTNETKKPPQGLKLIKEKFFFILIICNISISVLACTLFQIIKDMHFNDKGAAQSEVFKVENTKIEAQPAEPIYNKVKVKVAQEFSQKPDEGTRMVMRKVEKIQKVEEETHLAAPRIQTQVFSCSIGSTCYISDNTNIANVVKNLEHLNPVAKFNYVMVISEKPIGGVINKHQSLEEICFQEKLCFIRSDVHPGSMIKDLKRIGEGNKNVFFKYTPR